MLRQLRHPATILALVVVLAGTGLAVAANPSSDGTITACVSGKANQLLLASPKGRCKKGDTKLRWNQRGATGANGARGATGPAGTTGPQGVQGNPGADASDTARATSAAEVTTTSTTPVDLGGPSVTVQVPAGGAVVALGTNFDAKNSAGSSSGVLFYDGSNSVGGAGSTASASYTRVHGSAIVAADSGSHTYSLRYQSGFAGATASYQNRTLIASVLK